MRSGLVILLLLLGGCRGCGRGKTYFLDLKNAPPRVEAFVEEGDYHYSQAMKHQENSDPNVNPDGWWEQNKLALQCFHRAANEGYIPAQDEYGTTSPPQELLDRVRETMMRMSLCRKRSVSTRR